MTIDRMCASGLVAIASAAKSIMTGEHRIAVAGGLESISLTQNAHKNSHRAQSRAVLTAMPTAYIPMIETAELVAERYDISRAARDDYALASQQRTAAAQRAGLFDDEIVPCPASSSCSTRKAKPAGTEAVTLAATRVTAPTPRSRAWRRSAGVEERRVGGPGPHITAGNASQLSDGASASVLMSRAEAVRRGLSRAYPRAGAGWDAGPTRWASARFSRSPSCCRPPG